MASPRPQFYHPAPDVDATLRGLERCVRRAEGAGLVVGAAGTGKSLVLLKLAEHLRDDFDVALLTGASICTRRALWQAVLAAIGEPYRGIDEAELRIAVVERIRGLAAAGSGLVILVDEAHTLPTRLIEELRLLTNVPTPLPAVHIVLAGTARLEETLAAPRMESLAQRIAVRGYLEPLDHAETMAFLRTQARAAGLAWEALFEEGCDDAVFRVSEGVPRLINQVCDQALVLVAESGRRAAAADIAAAWREIQRLPAPSGLEVAAPPAALGIDRDLDDQGFGVVEFGADDDGLEPPTGPVQERSGGADARPTIAADLWEGPDVELVFGAGGDPFEEFFEREDPGVERYVVEGPDDFSGCRQVASREGQALGRLLATVARDEAAAGVVGGPRPAAVGTGSIEDRETAATEPRAGSTVDEIDDSDMVVIEEDFVTTPDEGPRSVTSVRPSDYRSLFTRLRRGDRRG